MSHECAVWREMSHECAVCREMRRLILTPSLTLSVFMFILTLLLLEGVRELLQECCQIPLPLWGAELFTYASGPRD